MMFMESYWLLAALPLGAAIWLWPMPGRLLVGLRIAVMTLLVAAMASLCVRLPGRGGVVVVVADRSLSMPADAKAAHEELMRLLYEAKSPDEQIAAVSFGATAAIERGPEAAPPGELRMQVSAEASNLHDALETGLSLIGPDRPGRLLVLSDGLWSGEDPRGVVTQALARGAAIDYRMTARGCIDDLAIDRIEAPMSVTVGEAFTITAWVHSPLSQEVAYELYRGGARIASGSMPMQPGLTKLCFRDKAPRAGAGEYELRVRSKSDDGIAENNTARLLVGVEGPLPILCVYGGDAPSGLPELLKAGGLSVDVRRAPAGRWSIEDLANYSAVVLEDTPADMLPGSAKEVIAAWVRHTGSGLMMTGGKAGFGTGGYFRSVLEEIMPVTMELRREHRKLAVAIVVALDRSGSMTASVGGGRTKMDLANLGTAQVLDLLSPMDEMGVLAVDTSAHVITPLEGVKDKGLSRSKILQIASSGGGIYVFEALNTAAGMLSKAQSQTRHIILFADAADSEEPGAYCELLEKCRQSNITCSVIGLGSESDTDAALLKDVAARGGGRMYFTNSAQDLPRLFAQDTFIVARSSFVDEPTPVEAAGGLVSLTGWSPESLPNVGGYNLTYIRPEASLGAVTKDEYKAPLVASWRVGAGRVLCYTGQADGPYTGDIGSWGSVGEFFTSLARWTAGRTNPLPRNMLATQTLSDGMLSVRLLLDVEGDELPPSSLPEVAILRGSASPHTQTLRMQWSAPDELVARVPLDSGETALATVCVNGMQATLSPVCLPYSPEFRRNDGRSGQATLESLADSTGGKERIDLSRIWRDMPAYPRFIELRPWLLLAAGLLLGLEVLQRRTRLLDRLKLPRLRLRLPRRPKRQAAPAAAVQDQSSAEQPPGEEETPVLPQKTQPPVRKTAAKAPQAKGDDDVISAMRAARQRRRAGE